MALGIIGLPIPDETILTFAGYLVSQNHLQLLPTIISSILGTLSGISISFLIGRKFGIKFLNKFGSYLHITDEKIERTHKWLEGYGSWVILFGYFLPGIRHLTAITAGSTKMNYSKFALFAFVGGLVWSLTFILLGYNIGKNWIAILERINNNVGLIILTILFLLIIYFALKYRLGKRK